MNIVGFPGLGLEFEISRIAFSLGKVDIYNYAICIVVGILVAIILSYKNEEKFYIRFDDFLEIIIWCIIFGVLGARLYYVIFNLDYYLKSPIKILNIRDGGLGIYGGLITGIIVLLNLCKKRKIDFWDFTDYIVPFVAIAQSIGRWGNFFNVEAYGTETTSFLRMRILSENNFLEVHPVFLYESIASFIIFLLLKNMQTKRKYKGQIFYLYLLLYSGVRMFLEPLRIDSLMILNFRVSEILSMIVFLYSTYILLKKWIEQNKKNFNKIKTK